MSNFSVSEETNAERLGVSVVIPNRNRSRRLLCTVLSVLMQADDRVEVIVVDDASDIDLSQVYSVLEGIGVRVIRQDHRQGGAAARNVGIRAARQAFVSLLDSDDSWLPGHYDRIRAFMARPDAMCSAMVSEVVLDHGDRLDAFHAPRWPKGVGVAEYVYRCGGRLQTSMITLPRQTALQVGFDSSLKVNQDTDFAIRLGDAGTQFVLVPGMGVIKDESDRRDRLSLSPGTIQASWEWYLRHKGVWNAATRAGYHLRDRCWRLLAAGQRKEALKCLVHASLPPVAIGDTLRIAAEILFGRSHFVIVRRYYRKFVHAPQRLPVDHPILEWQETLAIEAQQLLPSGDAVAATADLHHPFLDGGIAAKYMSISGDEPFQQIHHLRGDAAWRN